MNIIEYFKLQSKNLHKDFKTQKSYFDPSLGDNLFEHAPKFFDVDALVTDFDIDEDKFTLMNAQHIIARLAGFSRWTEMLEASPAALELSKLLFDNMHKINSEEWEMYISGEEREKGFPFDDEFKLDVFKAVFADVNGHQSYGYDYRLVINKQPLIEKQTIEPPKKKKKSTVQISSIPMAGANLKKATGAANWKFEDLLQMMEPKHPELVRKLWNPEMYIDQVIKPDMLPINRDYALSLIEAFLVHHFIELDTEAGKLV